MATATPTKSDIFPGVTLHNIEWEEYCKLRDDPAHDRLRMTYLDGELTIMSPMLHHDNGSARLDKIVTAVALAWDINFMPIRTTTLRRKGRDELEGASKEADEGFYLGDDEVRVRFNVTLDLSVDPPPSLAIEVDNMGDSESALPAYARIGVPEVWIYKARTHSLWFGRLIGDTYREVDRSVCLPRVTPALVLQALDVRVNELGDREWAPWLAAWARALPEPPAA